MSGPAEGPRTPIAVVGIGALLPGATGADQVWRSLVDGRDEIGDIPPDRWLPEDHYDPDPAAPDKTYARRGAFLGRTDFDPVANGIPPNQLPATDSAQLLGLVTAAQALRDLGAELPPSVRERTSVVLGSAALPLLSQMTHRLERPVWWKAIRELGVSEQVAERICDRIAEHYVPWQEATFPGLLGNVIAGRIANRFDLHGTNHTTDAACASSLSAVSVAMAELSLGRADLALAGGTDTQNGIEMFLCFSKTPALSPTGDCRPFSAAADGTMLGEGSVLLVLKRLADAERDADRIYAVIRGMGTSSDGRSTAIYAPLPEGQARALRRAYAEAGYGPDTVELVEAHGTGTRAGDRAEFAALRQVFAEADGPGRQWCALGSVKSQIGHTKCAAGAAGLLKAVLALHNKVLPPTIKVDRPGPDLELPTSPFYLNTRVRPWVHAEGGPRRASVSSFGFGGSNFHVTVEEYVPPHGVDAETGLHRAAPTELALFSASGPPELTTRLRAASTSDATGWAAETASRARASQRAFDPAHPVRLAVVVPAGGGAAEVLARAADQVDHRPDETFGLPGGVHYGCGGPPSGRVAFLFPGQGSQYVGMGSGLAVHEPAARRAWDRAAARWPGDEPPHRVVFPPPAFTDDERSAQERLLTRTEWAQPALAVHSLALLAVLARVGLTADVVAGHSFGELVALHHAGVFDADTLVRLGRRRGELMRDAAAHAPGSMTVVAAPAEDVERVIAEAGLAGTLVVANHNAPKQVTVSGETRACAELERLLGERGTATHRLAAAAAFHSPLMSGVVAPFAEFVAELAFGTPAIPVYGNADAAVHPSDPDALRARVAEHLLAPVRFVEQVEAMYADGVRVFVEVGTGTVLTGLVGRILGAREHLAVPLDHRDRDGVTALQDGLGRLAAHGMALDLDALWAPFATSGERPAGAESRKSAMTVPVDGGNLGRRYPVAGDNVVLPAPAPVPSEVEHRGNGAVEAAPGAGGDDGWLGVVQDAQRQTAEVHAEYLRTMTETHTAFLRMSEESMAAVLGGPLPEPVPSANGHSRFAPAQVAPAMPEAPALPAPAPAAVPEPEPAADLVEESGESDEDERGVVDVVLSVVSRLTGYPAEILDLDMGLESDLGIDSIKRVEILSAMREQVSGLPRQDVARLAKLRTLREVVDAVEGRSSRPEAPLVDEPSADEPRVDERAEARRSPAPAESAPPVHRSAVRACPAPATGLAMPGLADGPVVVTEDGAGVAAEVVGLLAEHGVEAAVAAEPSPDARCVLFLGGLAPVDGPEQADAVLRAAFRTARTVAGAFADRGGVFVTVQDTGGDFGLSGRCGDRAWLGGIAALARTAAQEWPAAGVKAIDCERAGRDAREVAEAVVGELLGGGATTDVGLAADGTRVVLRAVTTAVTPERHERDDRLGPDAVVLVSGGARGITAAALRALVAEHRPRLVLLGRTPLADEPDGLAGLADEPALVAALARRDGGDPAAITARARRVLAVREVRATLADLDPTGTRVRYVAVDVRREDELAEALREVRARWGPITGLVHAAGVLADHRIEDKTDDQLDAVLGTKLGGLRALLAATAADPLSLLCLFSSVAGVFGNAGQADYAMANAALDTVASVERARRPGCLVRALAWGPWRGGMVTPAVARRFTGAGVALLEPDAGAAAFVAELSGPATADSRVVLAASAPPPPPPAPSEVHVTGRTHPHLRDHRPLDVPVVPVAVVLEWFARAVRAWRPGDGPLALCEVRVLSTAALPRLDDGGHRFVVAGRDRDGELRLELRGEASRSHFQAVVDVVEPPAAWTPPAGLAPPAEPMAYGGPTYFHGPALQVIRSVEAVGAAGLVAEVAGLREQGWGGTGWLTDPAATDGVFQSAVLWAEHVLGAGTLPMAVERYRLHRPGPLPAGGRCVVRAVAVHADAARCDVALLDTDGTPWAELLGVALVRRPR